MRKLPAAFAGAARLPVCDTTSGMGKHLNRVRRAIIGAADGGRK